MGTVGGGNRERRGVGVGGRQWSEVTLRADNTRGGGGSCWGGKTYLRNEGEELDFIALGNG